jgi:uroporphyrinogen III methyltransferase/synthase
LRRRGAEPVELPLLELVPPPDPGLVSATVGRLKAFDVVAFSSANAVAFFFQAMDAQGGGPGLFAGVRIAAIGRGTAEALRKRGLTVAIMPATYVGEALAEAILADPEVQARPRPRVLLLRALAGRDIVAGILGRAGCRVTLVPVYETRPASQERREELLARLEAHAVDWVLLASSSAVNHLLDLIGADALERLRGVRIASIGPITSASARSRGLWVDVTADENTLEGTIVAMEDWARTNLPHSSGPGNLSLGPVLLHPASPGQPRIKSRD